LQVARSSKQAADRVSQKLLGPLMRSATQGISGNSDRSATEFSMALICTFVEACQEVYAEAYQQAASRTAHTDTERGIDGLSLDFRAQDTPATVSPCAGTAGVLAGRGADLVSLAVRSAAACAQPNATASAVSPADQGLQDVKAHSSSSGIECRPQLAYPTHEFQVMQLSLQHQKSAHISWGRQDLCRECSEQQCSLIAHVWAAAIMFDGSLSAWWSCRSYHTC
jgi:hypothetical protein